MPKLGAIKKTEKGSKQWEAKENLSVLRRILIRIFSFFVFEEFKASWKPQGVKGFHYPNVKFEIYAWG